jgi:hypothetical protein
MGLLAVMVLMEEPVQLVGLAKGGRLVIEVFRVTLGPEDKQVQLGVTDLQVIYNGTGV